MKVKFHRAYQVFKTMSVKSIMINCVESQYTQEYIANVFWRQHIAKVSSITLIPYLKNSEIYSIAYIYIDEWCDSEAAYNFIQRLKDPSKEARLVHYDDVWWPVEINTHNNGDICVGAYTLAFTSDYFVKALEDVETANCTDDDETAPCNDIQYFSDLTDTYSVEQAEAHVEYLKDTLARELRKPECMQPRYWLEELRERIAIMETELRIHRSVQNSQNVTLRESKKPRFALVHPEENINDGLREIACSNMW